MRDPYKRLRLAQYLTLAAIVGLLGLAVIGPNRCISPTADGAEACASAVAQSQSQMKIAMAKPTDMAKPTKPVATVQR